MRISDWSSVVCSSDLPIVNRKSGRAACRCSTYSLTDDDGEIVRRYELVRPTRSERMRQDLLLETMWEESSEEEFSALWQAEVEEMRDKTRTSTLYLVDLSQIGRAHV